MPDFGAMVAAEMKAALVDSNPHLLSLEEGELVLSYGGVQDWMVEITLLPMGARDVAL
jgi:hypothetical protein